MQIFHKQIWCANPLYALNIIIPREDYELKNLSTHNYLHHFKSYQFLEKFLRVFLAMTTITELNLHHSLKKYCAQVILHVTFGRGYASFTGLPCSAHYAMNIVANAANT